MQVYDITQESRDTILTNARALRNWAEAARTVRPCWHGSMPGTRRWTRQKARNPAARLVCIDIQPYGTTQTAEQEDALNIGGFSDAAFDQMAEFASGQMDAPHWVGQIMAQTL